MLDVDWGDLIYYLGEDQRTKAIVIYMESIGNARSFLSAAREVSLTKPIIVIKAGRTAQAAKAAASHTGSLAGSDEVLDAAFRRCGVLRVERISELFNMAEVSGQTAAAQGPEPDHPDQCRRPRRAGHRCPDRGRRQVDRTLQPRRSNDSTPSCRSTGATTTPSTSWVMPVPERYASTLDIAAEDPNSDGLLVVLTPQDMTHPTQTAEQLVELCKTPQKKPILTSWMGGPRVAAGENVLNRANIPTFPYPDMAARIFNYMWQLRLQPEYHLRDALPARWR